MRITPGNVDTLYARLKMLPMKRKQAIDAFTSYLENETSWLTSPASTRFHLSCEKGLLMHSVGVAYQLLTLKGALLPTVSDESAVICGLFHDVGKTGEPGRPLYLRGDFEGWRYNPEVTAMALGVRSLYIVARHIPLSEDEAQAICCHDGQYVPENEATAHREAPLTLLLHYADYWQAHIYEDDARYQQAIKTE
jgi:hypothetical protein